MIDDIKLIRINTLFYRDDWKFKKKKKDAELKCFEMFYPATELIQQFAPVPGPIAPHIVT